MPGEDRPLASGQARARRRQLTGSQEAWRLLPAPVAAPSVAAAPVDPLWVNRMRPLRKHGRIRMASSSSCASGKRRAVQGTSAAAVLRPDAIAESCLHRNGNDQHLAQVVPTTAAAGDSARSASAEQNWRPAALARPERQRLVRNHTAGAALEHGGEKGMASLPSPQHPLAWIAGVPEPRPVSRCRCRDHPEASGMSVRRHSSARRRAMACWSRQSVVTAIRGSAQIL